MSRRQPALQPASQPPPLARRRARRRRRRAGARPARASAQAPQVNVYNWDTYIGETTLEDFTDATGIAVRYDLFASNDELFAKLRGGNPGYDVIFPTNDYVERMIAADMLLPLDHAKIPNMAQRRPGLRRSGVRPRPRATACRISGARSGSATAGRRRARSALADLFESDDYAGRIALLNSIDTHPRDAQVSRPLPQHQGSGASSTQAVEALIRNKPKIKSFAPDTGQDLLISGEVDVCLEYNGDILQVMEEDDDLAYVVPEEGSLLWEDNMCIPQGRAEPGERPQLHQLHPRRRGPRRDRDATSATPARTPPRSISSPRRTATTRRSTRRARCSSAARSRSTRARRSRACTPRR